MLGVISIYGPHSSGKTTLIERILERFPNFRIAVVKKTHFDKLDIKGKDTERLSERAYLVASIAGKQSVVIIPGSKDPREFALFLQRTFNPDLIIFEGYVEGVTGIAFPGDDRGEPEVVFNGSNEEEVFSIVRREALVKRVYDVLPHLDCGECGERNCEAFARAVISRGRKVKECKYHNPFATLSLTVNGAPVYLGPFVHSLVENVMMGILRSLKAPKEIEEFELRYRRR